MTAHLRDQLQQQLAGAYTLERELAHSGMSHVFVAEDNKLGRRIVIKVLREELAAGLTAERFQREIHLAARLQHPHIVPLITSGEAGALPFYTMPFIEGESLRERLRREGELPISDALRLLRELAEVLAYAHAHDVVHRDIKPENILLSGGHVMVTDFGVAKALSQATNSTSDSVTATGVAIGTPGYMAPEQCTGDPTIDHRVDIYALGVVAYEMLTGEPPFAYHSAAKLAAAHVMETPPPPTDRRAAVPPAVARLVMRCLEKHPADRPQSATDLARDIDIAMRTFEQSNASPIVESTTAQLHEQRLRIRAGLAVLILGLVVGGALYWRSTIASQQFSDEGNPSTRRQSRPLRTLAVLPFDNVSRDPREEYFSDGMTDELTSALGKIPGLRVAARSSAFTFKGRVADAREIGERLHVASMLQGSVRRSGTRLRITAQLVNASDGMALWGETYEREEADIFAIQDDIARAIVNALQLKLRDETAERAPKRSVNLEAYNLYLQGRYYWNRRDEEGFRKATTYFDRALRIDTTFALAYVGLADTYNMLTFYGLLTPTEAFTKARALARRAIDLDSSLAEAHVALADVLENYDWDWSGAEREYRRAIALNPNYPTAHHWYGFYLMEHGRFDEALREIRRAEEIDPLSPIIKVSFCQVLREARRPSEALSKCLEAQDLDPGREPAHFLTAQVYASMNQYDKAISEYEKVLQMRPERTELAALGAAYASAGRRRDAMRVLNGLISRAKSHYVPPSDFALIYIALGERDSAFAWLERARVARDLPADLKVDPAFDPIREDPRFAVLLRALGLQ